MIKTPQREDPAATPKDRDGPPNAEPKGVKYILFNSLGLAAIAIGVIGLLYFTNVIG